MRRAYFFGFRPGANHTIVRNIFLDTDHPNMFFSRHVRSAPHR